MKCYSSPTLFLTLFFLVQPLLCKTQTVVIENINSVSNGNFMSKGPQQRPLRWILGKGLQAALVTAEQRHSSWKDDNSLKVADSSKSNFILVRSEKSIVNPGTLYTSKAWIKGGTGTPPIFYIEFWDQHAQRIGKKSITLAYTNVWQEIKIELIAPNKSTHVSVSIASTAEDTCISFWDDISLVPNINYNPNVATGARELFIDNYRLESLVDIERIVHPGKKSKPLITPTEPWEGNAVYIYGTVLKDKPAGSGYRMWYTAYIDKEYFLCYATSTDGLSWVKPNLGILEFRGSRKNNICKVGGGTLVYDAYDPNPGRRYKLMTFDGSKDKFGYGVHFSDDGLNWIPYEGNPVISYGDVSNVAYDEVKGIFIASTKQRMLVSNTSVTPHKQDRSAFISTSKDFIHWTAPGAPGSDWTIAVEGDYWDDLRVRANGGIEAQIYGMPVYPYEGQYIGFPWVYGIKTYHKGIFAVTGDGPIQPQIATSRDLRHWSRPKRNPVLPLGNAGAWDDGTLYTASTMLVSDKELYIYYGAMNLPHGGSNASQTQFARIARATWRRDGFVSLHNAGDDMGIITTKTIRFSGNKLYVNAYLKPGGHIKVEVLDNKNKPITGFTRTEATAIKGNQLSAPVRWQYGSDLGKIAGKEIKLRFYLHYGALYSYWFANENY